MGNKKIKILLIGMSSNIGGIETYLYNLVCKSDRLQIQFDFLYPYDDKMAFEDELKLFGCNIYKICSRNKNYFLHIKELKKVYNNNYDFIHCNFMSLSWFEPIYFSKNTNSKIILHSHNAGFDKKVGLKTKILHFIGNQFIKKINILKVACGKDAGKFMFKNNPFTIFYNGIDVHKFSYNKSFRNEIRHELRISDNTLIIGTVAKLERQKNPLFLIEIFNECLKINSNIKLVIVGEGSLKEIMIDCLNKYGIFEKVIFLGKRFDVNKIYSAFDIYLMPSLFEGLSISLIEAQVNGLKCYTSSNIDQESNITGNVSFISLQNDSSKWARIILSKPNSRDFNVLKNLPKCFDANYSLNMVYEYYKKNLKGGIE